jgi:hypothetical protein
MQSDNARLKQIEEQIDWIISNPNMSQWVKKALEATRNSDPIGTVNELEILNHVIRARCEIYVKSILEMD